MNEQAEQREAPEQRPAEPVMHVYVSGRQTHYIWLPFIAIVIPMIYIVGGFSLPFFPGNQIPLVRQAFGVLLCLPIFLFTLRMASLWSESRIHRIADDSSVHSEIEFATLIGNHCWKTADVRSYRAALQALHLRGFSNRVLFLYENERPYLRPEPIRVPFHPTPLDEADIAFNELEAGLSAAEEGRDTVTDDIQSTTTGLLRRSMRRNFVATGIWLVVAIMGFNLLTVSCKSVRASRIDPDVFLFTIVILIFLGMAWYWSRARATTWLLIPGGLVFRKPRRGTVRSDVHVFVRERSVLVFRSASKHLWTMAVWDGKEFGLGQVSEDEVKLLLRAWLSPLAPPAVEKLVDLT